PRSQGQVGQESLSDVAGPTSLGAGPKGEATRSLPAQGPPAELIDFLAPPQAADELGRLGGYRVLHVLGSGATGVVFVAEDLQLQRRVALKVIRPAPDAGDLVRQRFLREARAAAVIDHENIVTIYQVGEDRGVPFLAMKLLQGETLDERLKREGQLLVHEVVRIGREIAEGLAAAHEQGLIHRDIKPANLFLEAGNGRVKIVDFGLARAASHDLQLTKTGTVVGTPAYMSPEQARGIRVDHRSDLFSMGCVLYRMCTGRTPFQAEDTLGMLTALAQDQPAPIKAFNPTVPAELVGLIARLLAKVPEARPQNAQSVAATLGAIEERVAASRSSEYLKPRRGITGDRPWWVTLLQILVPAALAALIYWYGPSAFRMIYDQAQDAIETLPSPFSRH
ncbi:MAG TPA: serine/threonine-protein kinase, partial [Gemmataceae bacterium]|nr:serine/threonine-protein kinase [Gemmataceae bacterium]